MNSYSLNKFISRVEAAFKPIYEPTFWEDLWVKELYNVFYTHNRVQVNVSPTRWGNYLNGNLRTVIGGSAVVLFSPLLDIIVALTHLRLEPEQKLAAVPEIDLILSGHEDENI